MDYQGFFLIFQKRKVMNIGIPWQMPLYLKSKQTAFK